MGIRRVDDGSILQWPCRTDPNSGEGGDIGGIKELTKHLLYLRSDPIVGGPVAPLLKESFLGAQWFLITHEDRTRVIGDQHPHLASPNVHSAEIASLHGTPLFRSSRGSSLLRVPE